MTLVGASAVALAPTGTVQINGRIQEMTMHSMRFIFIQLPLMENEGGLHASNVWIVFCKIISVVISNHAPYQLGWFLHQFVL